jgi:ABC-type oligopeptide transport system substrate-binding subunit
LLGGQAFYAQTKENKIDLAKFKGVKIISNLVLDVFLTSPYAQLPKLLTHPNLVVLSYDDYLRNPTEFFNHAKGTGPFQLSTISEEKTVLSRNNTYWKTDEFGNKLPFLQSIEAFYSVNESLWFQEGKVDMIQNVSAEKINLLFGSLEDAQSGKNKPHRLFQLKNKNLNFLVYNTNFPPFNNEQNRIAVDRSIDKVAVCDEVLDGDGDACLMSFVPSNYYSSLIKENKKITSKPKFFTGEINLFMKNTTSELGRLWVKEVAKQIENKTTVKVKIIIGGDADFERMWNNGEIHLTKYNWVADYPDPDSYLGVFYSKSSVANQLRFYSRQFDDLYLETFKKETKEDCLNAQFSCDRFLIDHAFVSPIFLQDFIFVVNVNMRDFRISTSGQIDLSTVFYKPIQKLI